MGLKKFLKKMLIGLGVLIASLNLIACGNTQKYDEEIEKEITRIVEDGELIDVRSVEEFVESNGPDTIAVDDFTYHKIGNAYKPGEYVLVANEGESANYSVIMDNEEYTLILSDSTNNYTVFDTLEGQYISVNGGEIYPIDEAPEVKKTADGAYPEGTYKVGVQIPAGEYVAKGDYPSLSTYVGVSYNDSAVGFCSNIRSAIITVDEGQYIEATWGDLYPLELTADLKPTDGIYKEGTYKVGFHMPAGTYELRATVDRAYVDIYNDGYMVGRGDKVIVAEPKTNFTVSEGQFVVIVGGEATALYELLTLIN